jgi:hypothetical protein
VLEVVLELPLVNLSVGFSEDSPSLAGAVGELALVGIAVGPAVLAVAVRFAHLVGAAVLVAVGEFLLALAVLEEVAEVAAVLGAARVDEVPLAVLAVVPPLALVGVPARGTPRAPPVLAPLPPLPLELLAVVPHKTSLSAPPPVQELPRVHPVPVPFEAAYLGVTVVGPFIDLAFRDEDALAMLLLVLHLPEVNVAVGGDDVEVLLLDERLEVELGVHGCIVAEEVLILFCLGYFEEAVGEEGVAFLATFGFGDALRLDVGVAAGLFLLELVEDRAH